MNNRYKVIDASESDPQEIIPYTYSITAYGADFPVDALVKRMKSEDIFVPPFQRGYVWNIRQASRFIESLLLGLPVPAIFLSVEYKSQKMLVIDGQQRLKSLKMFCDDGIFNGKEFKLTGVQNQFEGITYNTLRDEDKRRLDDSIIHTIIVKQDEPSDDQSSIYHIFERLNTGGTLLRSQEIRACIYHGSFNEMLKEMNANKYWRQVFGKEDKRMKDQELILRFLAFYYKGSEYKRPMKEFLNSFMGHHRNINKTYEKKFWQKFYNTIEVISKAIGNKAFRPEKGLNVAVFDSVMVGIARRLDEGNISDFNALKSEYFNLLKNPNYIDSYIKATSDERRVKRRLNLAIDAFKGIS